MHIGRRALLAGLLGALAVPAAAQSLGLGFGLPDVAVRGGGGATAPLDGFTSPSGAYSFRKLRTAYAGPAVKLQRVDTTTQDVGFVGVDFDTAAATAFCTTACTINTRYDQSGNGRHQTQATAANQPVYIANCTGGQPCLEMTAATQSLSSTNITPATGIGSLSTVANRITAATGACVFLSLNGASGSRIQSSTASASNWQMASPGGNVNGLGANSNQWHVAQAVISGGAGSITAIDGAENTGTSTGSVTAGGIYTAGQTALTCREAEAIAWDNYQLTPGERTALTNNQINYWMPAPLDNFTAPSGAYSFRKLRSTYSGPAIRIRRASDNLETDINFLGFVPGLGSPWDEAAAAAHCAATSCFLTTWYDQSGAARHLVQATQVNQPALVFNCNGSLPCMRSTTAGMALQTAANTTPATGLVSVSIVGNRSAGTGICIWLRENGAANRLTTNSTASSWIIAAPALAATAADAAWHAAAGVINGAASVINIDGTETTGTVTGTTVAGLTGLFGAVATTCNEGEVVFWDSYALPTGERTALVNNQRSFWGF